MWSVKRFDLTRKCWVSVLSELTHEQAMTARDDLSAESDDFYLVLEDLEHAVA